MYSLTKRQKEILDFISQFRLRHGYMPSYREIAAYFRLSAPSTIHQHVKALIAKGYLKHIASAARSIQLSDQSTVSGMIELPLVGVIAAGEPIEAVEEREVLAVPEHLVENISSFILKVKGNSMIEDGILDGDYVIVERNFYPKNGDVVVALLDNTYATLKRYYREKDRIRLQPANSSMLPIFVKNPAIQGVVKGIFRKFTNF